MESWNYEKPHYGDQLDWNQTLVTALNCIVSENNLSHKSKIETIVPIKFKPLIESLIFYNNDMIGDKYCIHFIDENFDEILIEECVLDILNFDKQ
jgi:hypothetical protein